MSLESVESHDLAQVHPSPIHATVEIVDHSGMDTDDVDEYLKSGLWAVNARVVNPSPVGSKEAGFVSYLCLVTSIYGTELRAQKRYSEFDEFRRLLLEKFPLMSRTIPKLPPKSMVKKYEKEFIEKRRIGLELFLSSVLLNPELAGSSVVKEWWCGEA